MAVDTDITHMTFTNVLAGVPIPVAIKTFEPAHVFVQYGLAKLDTAQYTDFTVNIADDYESFTVTPTVALLNKINALPVGNNVLLVERILPLTTDFRETDAFIRRKIENEFDKTTMRIQQVRTTADIAKDAIDSFVYDVGAVHADRVAADVSAGVAAAAASALGNQVHQYDTYADAVAAGVAGTISNGVRTLRVTRYANGHQPSFATFVHGSALDPMAFPSNGIYWVLDITRGTMDMRWTGVNGDGGNYTTAFAVAVSIARAYALKLLMPKGGFELREQTNFNWDYATIEGSGNTHRDTDITFNPQTAGLVCFNWRRNASIGDIGGLSFGMARAFTIRSKAGNGLLKTAIEYHNTSNFTIEYVNVQQFTGSGFDIGVRHGGRELTKWREVILIADIPVNICQNADRAFVGGIDCDFPDLDGAWIIGVTTVLPLIKVDPGVNLTSMLWRGKQSWNRGGSGFSWTDPTPIQISVGLTFQDVRAEQMPVGAYMVAIDRTTYPLCSLRIERCNLATSLLYGRGIQDTILYGNHAENGGGSEYIVNLDGDNCDTLTLLGNWWQVGMLANMPNFAVRTAYGSLATFPAPAALPTSGEFVSMRYPLATALAKGQRSGASQKQGSEWWRIVDLAPGADFVIPVFAGLSVDQADIRVCGGGESGAAHFAGGGMVLLYGTPNFSVSAAVGKLAVLYGTPSIIYVHNGLAGAVKAFIRVEYSSGALIF